MSSGSPASDSSGIPALITPSLPGQLSLKLYDPDDLPPQPPPPEPLPEKPYTLRMAFEEHVLPDLIAEGKARKTIEQYRSAIHHWEYRTLNPGVLSGDQEELLRTLNREARRLRDSMQLPCSILCDRETLPHGHSAFTINKTWGHLRPIFRILAKPGDRNPAGKGIIDRPPHMKPVKGDRRRMTSIVPAREITKAYKACIAAPKLRRCKLPTFLVWQTAIVLYHIFGPRTFDLTKLTWKAITWSPAHPDPRIKLANKWGWISYRTTKTGAPLILPLNSAARSHLKRIRRGDDDLILPLPKRKAFYRHWKLIRTAARVSFSFQDLRVTANNNWFELSSTEPHLGIFVLGHKTGDVNTRFYLRQTRQLLKVLRDYPRLKCFREVRALAVPKKQLSLFDMES
ncbi:MAG: hypothetical protein AB7G12_12565 [Thermoanaerobaculia bacterium]